MHDHHAEPNQSMTEKDRRHQDDENQEDVKFLALVSV